jgi:CubicO group peptidase (beta-lactamase class C family)
MMGTNGVLRLIGGIWLALLLASCATVHSDFDLSFSDARGFHEERLDRIDAVINAEIESGRIPGAVGLIAKDGEIVYHRAFGMADIDTGEPMQADSIFRIASMTKAITSVGVMMLYEQGRFQLNDPVSKYLPAFANPRVVVAIDDNGIVTKTREAKREIRIVDLLSHSSGIGYAFTEFSLQRAYKAAGVIDGLTAANKTLAEGMTVLAPLPIAFDPGEEFLYGLNTDVLGYLIEVVSGKTLDAFFRDEIFTPLGMNDTYFYLPDAKADRLVTLYADVGHLKVSDGTEDPLTLDNPRYPVEGAKRYFSGGAGLSSTAYDYFRFVQMLLQDGELDGVRLLSRKSVELMQAPRIDWDADGIPDFGLGFEVVTDLGRRGELGSVGTYSWGGAFGTNFLIDPKENIVAIFMTQARPLKSDIRDKYRNLVYQALQ